MFFVKILVLLLIRLLIFYLNILITLKNFLGHCDFNKVSDNLVNSTDFLIYITLLGIFNTLASLTIFICSASFVWLIHSLLVFLLSDYNKF